MKKTTLYVLTAVLLCALSLAVLAYAHSQLTARGEDVTVTETTLFGDQKEAAGVTVKTRIKEPLSGIFHCWEFSTITGKPVRPSVKSHMSIDAWDYQVRAAGSVRILGDLYTSYGSDNLLKEYQQSEFDFPRNIFDAVSGKTAKGKKHREKIRLADYLSCFPLDAFLDISHGTPYKPNGSYVDPESYFQIPVPEDFYIRVSIKKNDEGIPTDINVMPAAGDGYFNLNTLTFYTEDSAYVALTHYTIGEKKHRIPSRLCGIHKIPLKQYRASSLNRFDSIYMDMDHARKVYDLPPMQDLVHMGMSEDGKDLLLFTREKENIVLSVIDMQTMTLKQTFPVFTNASKDLDPYEIYTKQCDNVLLFFNGGREISVLESFSGGYRPIAQVNLARLFPDEDEYVSAWNMTTAYDGDTLALAFQPGEYMVHQYSHYLLIYKAARLRYAGYYENSLSQVLYCNNDDSEEPLTVTLPHQAKEAPQ